MDDQRNNNKESVGDDAIDTSAPEVSNVSESERSTFSINAWFNESPIRIVGTAEFPMFYAADVAAALGRTNVRTSIKNFDETEIITPEQRAHAKVVTYCLRNGNPRRDDRIILLSEFGVYRMIFNAKSKKDTAEAATVVAFKRHIYRTIYESRIAEKTKLMIMASSDHVVSRAKYMMAIKELAGYKKNVPVFVVFSREINDNPYKHIQRNHLPADNDVDPKVRDDTAPIKTLYKCTSRPSADDYATYTLVGRIYAHFDRIEEILGGSDDQIETNLAHAQHTWYMRSIEDLDGEKWA